MKNPLGDGASQQLTDLTVTTTDFVYTRGVRPETMNSSSRCGNGGSDNGGCYTGDNYSHATGQQLSQDTFYRDRLDDMVGDVAVVCPLVKLADKMVANDKAGNGKLYFYHFVQRSSQNPWPKWMGSLL